MEVDGKKIPESEFSKYDDLVKKILKQISDDHFINYEQLNEQYLTPIKAVAEKIKTQ